MCSPGAAPAELRLPHTRLETSSCILTDFD
jgi:hypothetical protein